jgi:14-3-3 protein epsilon
MALFEGKKGQVEFDAVPEEDKRSALVWMAQAAEASERYEDMSRYMRQLVLWTDSTPNKEDLTVEERNLLSVAFKNVIGYRRASWRTLNGYTGTSNDVGATEKHAALTTAFKNQVETELKMICEDILGLLEDILIKNNQAASADAAAGNEESKVFYLKMAGDYYRYLAECVLDQGHDKKASDYYGQAYDVAMATLPTTHPVRLGLALNYSVCYYEILKNKKKACQLAKKAFDLAIQELDKLPEEQYKDSTLIMQLLRDNLTLWTSNDSEEGGADE